MNQLVMMAEEQVKQNGLNRQSSQAFEDNIASMHLSARTQTLTKKISRYLREEGEQISSEQTLLGTSDVIESIFGKYKYISSESPLRDLGKMLLTIPVLTTELTCELVKTAMETVPALAVDKWADELLGKSSLSKRRMLSAALKVT